MRAPFAALRAEIGEPEQMRISRWNGDPPRIQAFFGCGRIAVQLSVTPYDLAVPCRQHSRAGRRVTAPPSQSVPRAKREVLSCTDRRKLTVKSPARAG
jgi:hypothetical protein